MMLRKALVLATEVLRVALARTNAMDDLLA